MFAHVIVLGAGAIGSIYAAKLAARHEVTIVARPEHVDAINRHGLRLVGHEAMTCRVRAITRITRIEPGTLVLLTTQVNDNASAAAAIAGLVQPDTIVLCVQNGLGGEDIVRAAVRDRCLVLRAITQFGAIFREPGLIDFKVSGYTLVEDGLRSAGVAALLTDAG